MAEDQVYPWKRFWIPQGKAARLTNEGYLYDSENHWEPAISTALPFAKLTTIPCLILLGEPETGKSFTAEAEQTTLHPSIVAAGGQTLWINLAAYQSDVMLYQAIFEDPTFREWRTGSHQLHLFFDNLDQCLTRIPALPPLLLEEFQKYVRDTSRPLDRLFLRLICRTGDWPFSLERGLRNLWKTAEVYELAPLRQIDVAAAALVNKIDPTRFLDEIKRVGAVPLAVKPVTLDFLLKVYQRDGRLSYGRQALYAEGCRLLCEQTPYRRDARLVGNFATRERIVAAAHLAYITLFSNRQTIRTDTNRGDLGEEEVTVDEIVGSQEHLPEISELAMRDALTTGLFTTRGPQRLGWVHHTYAEYLAAYYLQQQMTPKQTMSLLTHPTDPEGKIAPPLQGVAAWLAEMQQEVFRKLLEIDPEVLLRADLTSVGEKERFLLVESLLHFYQAAYALNSTIETRWQYQYLAQPGLAEQLRPYLVDSAKNTAVRQFVCEVAEACHLQSLQDDLIGIVLDASQDYRRRIDAAHAVVQISDPETKASLKPLALGLTGDDPDDSLKGYGLQAVWPAHFTTKELFNALTPSKRENYIGAYQAFLAGNFLEALRTDDLPTALEWAERQLHLPHNHTFSRVIDTIFLGAWEQLEDPRIAEAFARAALLRLQSHDEIVSEHLLEGYGKDTVAETSFSERLSRDHTKRHCFIQAALSLLLERKLDPGILCYSRTSVVTNEDVFWLLEWFQTETDEAKQQVLAQLLVRAFDWHNNDQVDAMWSACQSSPLLADSFSWLFQPVPLNSPLAQQMKEHDQERQTREKHQKEPPLLDPPLPERLAHLLAAWESGEPAAWWRLNMELTLAPHSIHYGDEFEADLTSLPGWKIIDENTSTKLIEIAKHYVLEQDPQTDEWLGKNTLHRPAAAGYRAFILLQQKAPEFLLTLAPDIWKRWVPILLGYPLTKESRVHSLHDQVINIAYRYAAPQIREFLLRLIDSENKQHDFLFCLHMVEGCWDMHLAAVLLEKAQDDRLKLSCMEELLRFLLEHQFVEAKEFAASFVSLPLIQNETRSKALISARLLTLYADDAGWPVMWPLLQQDSTFGRDLIIAIQRVDFPGGRIAQRLTEEELADLYIWLVQQFPPAEDPQVGGFVEDRGLVGWWRDSILRHLQGRGTSRAVVELQRIARLRPELEWLQWTIQEAQKVTRLQTWASFHTSDLLKLIGNRRARLVQNGTQLLDILLESLERLEKKLQWQETPAAIDLWNEIPVGQDQFIYRPKDENRLSDYIKRHLHEDIKQQGIIVNREVEIRRGKPGQQGQRTDIHVDALIRVQGEVYDRLTAIIEVKGSWGGKWKNGMKDQLVDRYLLENQCYYGLYLVGWFTCEQWDKPDQQKRKASQMSLEVAREILTNQAVELSKNGFLIKAVVLNTRIP